MRTIKVNLAKRSYQVIIGYGVINKLGRYIRHLNLGTDAYIITNSLIKKRYGQVILRSLNNSGINSTFNIVADSEKAKSLSTSLGIIEDLARFDQKKRVFVIAFGGGVVGDLSGFIASIYKRGIPYIQIPTTLLAQVDSSIGGKTGVDLIQGKNLVGAFYQPRLVFSDVRFLKTLDSRQIKSGLAEVIKYSIIKDLRFFVYLERRYKDILALKSNTLEFMVRHCSYIKAGIVQQDEREEKGIRTTLNFGHTLGHAIEAAQAYKGYNHGEAIALGMLLACDISRNLRLINNGVSQRIENLIKAVGLPTKIRDISVSEIIKAHYRDKKFIGPQNKFVLVKGIGKTKVVRNIPLKIIRQALKMRT